MLAQQRIGHLEFGGKECDILTVAARAIDEFKKRYIDTQPTLLMISTLHEQLGDELAKLGLEILWSGTIIPDNAWVGTNKAQSATRPVRQVPSSYVCPQCGKRNESRQWEVIEGKRMCADCANKKRQQVTDQITLSYFRLFVPALPAPDIAGLLCAVNPTTEPETDDGEDEEPIAVLLPAGMRRARIRAMLDRQLEDHVPHPAFDIPIACKGDVLPQTVTMHPRDVLRELAESKAQPSALRIVKPARSSEELLEEAAMSRTEVTPAFLDDFMEALKYAVEHLDDADAGLLVDGHRLSVLDQKGIVNLYHPEIRSGSRVVALRMRPGDPYRFVAKRHEMRAYLSMSKNVFEGKGITPIRAGEQYSWEAKAA